jgi:membrane protein implicated in regulation of membrane protease activity
MEFLIYSICFGVGFVFTIVSAIFGHEFGGHDVHVDVGHAHTGGHAATETGQGGMPGLSLLSPTVIASFVTAMGGFGMILARIDATKPLWISLPLSVIGGLLIAAAVFFLFNAIFKLVQGSSESCVASLIGKSATIITPIPAGGVGEIAYVQGGTRYTAPARTSAEEPLPQGKTVYIVRIDGTQFYVATI